jgi:hypothetical protein
MARPALKNYNAPPTPTPDPFKGMVLPITDYQHNRTDRDVLAAEERGFKGGCVLSREMPELDENAAYVLWNGAGKEKAGQ